MDLQLFKLLTRLFSAISPQYKQFLLTAKYHLQKIILSRTENRICFVDNFTYSCLATKIKDIESYFCPAKRVKDIEIMIVQSPLRARQVDSGYHAIGM